jgi:hypothetical protein
MLTQFKMEAQTIHLFRVFPNLLIHFRKLIPAFQIPICDGVRRQTESTQV